MTSSFSLLLSLGMTPCTARWQLGPGIKPRALHLRVLTYGRAFPVRSFMGNETRVSLDQVWVFCKGVRQRGLPRVDCVSLGPPLGVRRRPYGAGDQMHVRYMPGVGKSAILSPGPFVRGWGSRPSHVKRALAHGVHASSCFGLQSYGL